VNYEGRIDKVRSALHGLEADALLVTNLNNVAYLTGFTGSNGQVLVWDSGALFLSDGRYRARAHSLVKGAEIEIYDTKLTDSLPARLSAIGATRLAFEAGSTTVQGRDETAKALEGVELIPSSKVIEDLRRIKEPGEIELIQEAVRIGDDAFTWVLDRIVPGAVERDIALDLEVYMRQHGAEAISFDPIVGSGPLSAHIHHSPSDRQIEKGDLVLLDFGCRHSGYCSDLTRTVVVGPATDEQRDLYALVLAAQAAGIDAVRAGVTGVDADAAARKVMTDGGRGDVFNHGLGHGVGLEIHEDPRLHRISKDTLRAGDVVTVEPGGYLADWGGVRIEDCVLVTDEGARVLGSAPKDTLIEL
jgi:Xaa-Pro aminopeptidase